MAAGMERPTSVAAYFRSLPKDQRPALQKLREAIASAAPEAKEGITYSFGYDERFPATLIRKVVQTRLAEADARRVRRKT